MDETISKRYGATGVWITDTATYSDGLDVVKLNDKRIGTLVATFIGELKDAISAAPPLNSLSALLDPDMRLHSRQFQKNGDSVTATFTYGVFEDETPSYTMNAQPKKISLLSSSRFAKISDVERVLAQAYLNGMTDATTVWRNKKGTSAEIAESVPAEERKNWERTTLGSLVSRYASGSTIPRRRSCKSRIGNKINSNVCVCEGSVVNQKVCTRKSRDKLPPTNTPRVCPCVDAQVRLRKVFHNTNTIISGGIIIRHKNSTIKGPHGFLTFRISGKAAGEECRRKDNNESKNFFHNATKLNAKT